MIYIQSTDSLLTPHAPTDFRISTVFKAKNTVSTLTPIIYLLLLKREGYI